MRSTEPRDLLFKLAPIFVAAVFVVVLIMTVAIRRTPSTLETAKSVPPIAEKVERTPQTSETAEPAPPTPAAIEWVPYPVGTQFVAKKDVVTFTKPDRNSERSVPLVRGQVVPPSKKIPVGRGTISGEDWLSFPLGGSGARYYVPAVDLDPA